MPTNTSPKTDTMPNTLYLYLSHAMNMTRLTLERMVGYHSTLVHLLVTFRSIMIEYYDWDISTAQACSLDQFQRFLEQTARWYHED